MITYDIVSLVSDIGGTLGLFVGFSFYAFWDILKDLSSCDCQAPFQIKATTFDCAVKQYGSFQYLSYNKEYETNNIIF